MRFRRLVPLAVTLLASAARAESEGVHLDVKPGLWEMKSTTTTKMEGDLPRPDLSKVPPEQRARIEASLAERTSGKPRVSVWQSCITEEDVRKGGDFAFGEDEKEHCTRTFQDRTAKHVKFTMSCAPRGEQETKMDGTFEITVKGGDSIVSQGETKFAGGKVNGSTRFEFSGRRLGASCGDLKPKERRKISGD
jgi:hypothetical protein